MIDLPVAFRPATTDDIGFLFKTWLIDFHKVHPFNFIPTDIYKESQGKLITTIIQKCGAIICCLDDDPNQIVGYVIYEQFNDDNLIVHWAHVKSIYRRMGILKQLLTQLNFENKTTICSHFFSLYKQLRERYLLIYDPTILEKYK